MRVLFSESLAVPKRLRFLVCWCPGQDGYVDGVDAGEEASLQEGFCSGFKEGAAQTAAVGRLRGIVR